MTAYNQAWSFHNPTHLAYGPGSLEQLPGLAGGSRGLLITSPGFTRRGLSARVKAMFEPGKLKLFDQVSPNPDLHDVEASRQVFRGEPFGFITAIGGGSVIDTAKALSYLLANEDNTFSLQEHFIGKIPLGELTPLPLIAVPTTAGTGSEVTPFATIWDQAAKKKYSLAAGNLHPVVALLDPELTVTMPAETTIVTGLDALSHALESIWNHNANPVSMSYAARAVSLILASLAQLLREPQNLNLRGKMQVASLFGGLSISSTRTALAHSISYPLTARLGVPHGLACSFTLPALFAYNAGGDDGRFQEFARAVGFAGVDDLKEAIDELYRELQVERLVQKYNLTAENLLKFAGEMFTPGRADNNLRPVDEEVVEMILTRSGTLPQR